MFDNNRPPSAGSSPFAAFFEWVLQAIRGISEQIDPPRGSGRNGGRSGGSIPPVDPNRPGAGEGFATFPVRRSLGGHLISGMRKIEQARRSSAINKKHGEIAATIQLTRRSIKSLPRSERGMFSSYLTFLDDVARREKLLFQQLILVDGHLKRYDPNALREEIDQLERYLSATTGAASRYEAESALSARRELLERVQEFEERFSTIAAQLSHLCAMLDLNHLRIVSITTRASGSDTGMQNQMEEMSIQLGLLDESIRELDQW